MQPIASEARSRRACSVHQLWLVALLATWPWPGTHAAQPPVVRVAVVGGIELSGVWPNLAQHAGTALGLRIETVVAAPKESVLPAFKRGDADLLLIHGGDETFALQATGHAQPLRVWA